jgi:hypothetical protein
MVPEPVLNILISCVQLSSPDSAIASFWASTADRPIGVQLRCNKRCTIDGAVGIGSIGRFSYVAGENGGAIFHMLGVQLSSGVKLRECEVLQSHSVGKFSPETIRRPIISSLSAERLCRQNF